MRPDQPVGEQVQPQVRVGGVLRRVGERADRHLYHLDRRRPAQGARAGQPGGGSASAPAPASSPRPSEPVGNQTSSTWSVVGDGGQADAPGGIDGGRSVMQTAHGTGLPSHAHESADPRGAGRPGGADPGPGGHRVGLRRREARSPTASRRCCGPRRTCAVERFGNTVMARTELGRDAAGGARRAPGHRAGRRQLPVHGGRRCHLRLRHLGHEVRGRRWRCTWRSPCRSRATT